MTIQRSPVSVFKGVKPIHYAGKEMLPLIEGGKGVAVSNHMRSGAWAAAGGIGTVSAVNADSYAPTGKIIPQIYRSSTRLDRHEELIHYAIVGTVEKVRRAFELSFCPVAFIINLFVELAGALTVLDGA